MCFTLGPYFLALVECLIELRDLVLQLSDGPRKEKQLGIIGGKIVFLTIVVILYKVRTKTLITCIYM